jgi:hypothetical protein
MTDYLYSCITKFNKRNRVVISVHNADVKYRIIFARLVNSEEINKTAQTVIRNSNQWFRFNRSRSQMVLYTRITMTEIAFRALFACSQSVYLKEIV